ncbi:MAG TPA: translesion DNA synthesis-associated protein ImuA [Rhodanobacteraceae bacterium]|nr:translesion DNA synthesis-associated protein ImuA [Rhodanobacteraceae bacterium]
MSTVSAATALDRVLQHPAIWRRSSAGAARLRVQSSGWPELDARLPGGGWPLGALSEILFERDGLGEFGLTMPALAALTRARRRVVLVDPPYLPYPAALASAGVDLAYVTVLRGIGPEAPWSMEQCLRSGCCGAVLGWLAQADYRQLRRLQLAAASGDSLAILLRSASHAEQSSPAALRLLVSSSETNTFVDILKSRSMTEAAPAWTLR